MIFTISGWGAGAFMELRLPALQAGEVSAGRLPDPAKPDADSQLQAVPPVKFPSPTAEANTMPASQTTRLAAKADETRKIVYLTFDDGPSTVTAKVLDILQREKVKATFFVLGNGAKKHPELINAIWEQGHAIGNHTYNHDYDDLYSGFTRFWKQIKTTEEIVHGITGKRPQLVRAPGGTFGHFDDTYFYLMKQAGYSVMDWNVDSGDSKRRGVPAVEIIKDSVPNTTDSRVVLLMHDGGGHEETAKALPEIIARYKAAGYSFDVLDDKAEPVQFRVSSTIKNAGRMKPSAAWIASNIAPNSALFESQKPLVLEVGKREAKLASGEYFIDRGQYMVPLRTVMERLGGQVIWDKESRSGRARLDGRTLLADLKHNELIFNGITGELRARSSNLEMIGGVIWIPLRDLLEIMEHPPLTVSVTLEERRVRAD